MADNQAKEVRIEGFYGTDGTLITAMAAVDKPNAQLWVHARKPWQGTGFFVELGHSFRIFEFVYSYRPVVPSSPYEMWEARWSSNPRAFGPTTGAGAGGYPAPSGYVIPGAPESSLCYRIGGGPAKAPSAAEVADATGEISLMINDDAGAHFGAGLRDNLGRIYIHLERL